MRDRQQKRIYAWENQWADWNRNTCSLKAVREIVRWACTLYGVKPPKVMQHEGTAYSFSKGAPVNVISFRKSDQLNPAVALHEVAHHLSGAIFGERSDLEDHGPEFMGIYMWLMEGWRLAPRSALHASAKAAGIRWVPTWTMSPKRLRNLAAQKLRRYVT